MYPSCLYVNVTLAPIQSLRRAQVSGRMMKKKFSYMRQAYWGRDGIWSDGYFVSTIGINERIIQKYIEQQGLEDMGQAQLVLDVSRP